MHTTEGCKVSKELLKTLILQATRQVIASLAAWVSTAHGGIPWKVFFLQKVLPHSGSFWLETTPEIDQSISFYLFLQWKHLSIEPLRHSFTMESGRNPLMPSSSSPSWFSPELNKILSSNFQAIILRKSDTWTLGSSGGRGKNHSCREGQVWD